MALQLTAPTEKEFTLEKSDKVYGDPKSPTKIIVRQATQAQHERRSQLWSELTQEVKRDLDNADDDVATVRYIQKLSFPEIQRVEAYLTLVSCDILNAKGNELFKFAKKGNGQVLNMTEGEFRKAWGMLPPMVAQEIGEKVREVNISWGPQGEVL